MNPGERVIRLGPARSPAVFGAAEALLAAEQIERVATTLEGFARAVERAQPSWAEAARSDARKMAALVKRLRDVVRMQEALARPVA